MADDAGALLVRSGLISASALDEARAKVAQGGGTVGEQLVEAGAVPDETLTAFYRSRFLLPQVNPNTLARLSTKVIATLPSDMAIELRAIPVALDGENNLTVAMSDPSDRHAVDEIAFFTGTYVVRAVATQMQIAWCLAHYYGHVTPLGQRLVQPKPGSDEAQQAASTSNPGMAASTSNPGMAASTSNPALRAAASPRTKGVTGQIEAARHRAIPPGTTADSIARPRSDQLDAVKPATADGSGPTAAPATAATETPTREKSISGEIRVPVRRAPSIKPPMPDPLEDDDDDESPVISIVATTPDEDAAAKRKMMPVRRQRVVKTDPPELRARAGEVELSAGRDRSVADEGPRIIIDEEMLSPPPVADVTGELSVVAHRDAAIVPAATIEVEGDSVVIRDQLGDHSEPVALTRRRPSDELKFHQRAPSSADDPDDDEVVVLDAPKRPTGESPPLAKPRSARSTQVGIGVTAATTRAARDTETTGIPSGLEARDNDPTKVDGLVAPDLGDFSDETIAPPPPSVRRDDDTNPHLLAAPPKRTLVGIATPTPATTAQPGSDDTDDSDDTSDDLEDSIAGPATAVMSAVELDDVIPQRRDEVVPAHLAKASTPSIEYDPLDDGWGPPGTTIPPPLLGAIPGTDDGDAEGIPVSDVDSAPLMIGPPSPPEAGAPGPAAQRSLMKQLEEATQRVFELINNLERARDRDGVVKLVVAHLAETHRRAGFFSIRHGSARMGPNRVNELVTFTIHPTPGTLPTAALRLDRPSTLQDVVGTRLPYRGPMLDDASRSFLAQVLGTSPPEILLVPVAVRERVVGVFFGEHRLRHTFDDQLALAARAAGTAFERALKKR